MNAKQLSRRRKYMAEETVTVDGVEVPRSAMQALQDVENPPDPRVVALRNFLHVWTEDISEARYGDHAFEVEGEGEYTVLTDAEADAEAEERAWGDLWSFGGVALSDATGIPACMFDAISEDKCESATEIFQEAITNTCGREEFFKRISLDRARLLGHYDDNEESIKVGDVTWYIYRTN